MLFKEEIQQIFKSYKSDLSLNEAIRIVESHGKLNESTSISVESAFGTIVMKLYESIELNEALDPELEQIATQWAPMVKKLVDGGKDPVAKIKGAIEHLTKEGDITKEEVGPFIASLVSKAQVTDEIKKQLTSIGSASPEPKMPTSLPGVIAEVKKQVTNTKTPEEAEKKANDGIKKAGLKSKLLEYETGIYKWIGKLPLVGGWFSKRSKTQQRIIVLIAIAILSYLVYQGVKWAMKVMDEAGKAKEASSNANIATAPPIDYSQSLAAAKALPEGQGRIEAVEKVLKLAIKDSDGWRRSPVELIQLLKGLSEEEMRSIVARGTVDYTLAPAVEELFVYMQQGNSLSGLIR